MEDDISFMHQFASPKKLAQQNGDYKFETTKKHQKITSENFFAVQKAESLLDLERMSTYPNRPLPVRCFAVGFFRDPPKDMGSMGTQQWPPILFPYQSRIPKDP